MILPAIADRVNDISVTMDIYSIPEFNEIKEVIGTLLDHQNI